MVKIKIIFLSFYVFGCGALDVEPQDLDDISRADQLREKQLDRRDLARSLLSYDGWLIPGSCDGIHWSGKYAAADCGSGFRPEASEFLGQVEGEAKEPGRFGRRSPTHEDQGRCWNPDDGNTGLESTWSRDAAVLGLFPHAFRCGGLSTLQRHERHGRLNGWLMGKPVGDLRVAYTPNVVGELYQIIHALGGPDNANRHWPALYNTGLDDYHAHLQMMQINTRGEIAEKLGTPDKPTPVGLSGNSEPGVTAGRRSPGGGPDQYNLLNISEVMFERIKEHRDREPGTVFFEALHAIYSGDYGDAIDLCLEDSPKVGSYVRCGDEYDRCYLAEVYYSCDLIVRRL